MSEAKAGCTVWKDVGKGTFERFVQFAYTGDYSIPEMEERRPNWESVESEPCPPSNEVTWSEPVQEAFAEPEPEIVDGWLPSPGKTIKSKKDKKKGSKGRAIEPAPLPTREKYREQYPSLTLAADFHYLSYELLAPRNKYDHTCDPIEVFNRNHSYSEPFLSHASLWVLGDLWQVDSLKALALFKLHRTLCIFDLDDENMGDVIALTKYVYSDEGLGSDGGIGGLRGLVCQYMAFNALLLSVDKEFMDLLGEGGQFVKDFFTFELQRVH